MNTKLFSAALLSAAIVLSSCAQGGGVKTTDVASMSTIERIENAETFDEIVDCYDETALSTSNNSPQNFGREEILALNQKIYDFYFGSGMINGTYYYSGETAGVWGESPVDDTIYIYVENEETIYLVPTDAVGGGSIEQIPNIDNASSYAYRIPKNSEIDRYEVSHWMCGSNKECSYIKVTLKRLSDESLTTMRFYNHSKDSIEIIDDVVPNYLIERYPTVVDRLPKLRTYYSDKSALDAEVAERNRERAEAREEKEQERQDRETHEKEVRNSIPKVGMTADEVKMSRWGSPDDINKTEYSWGVKEQWVYRGKGYVYLKDGVVEAVSTE